MYARNFAAATAIWQYPTLIEFESTLNQQNGEMDVKVALNDLKTLKRRHWAWIAVQCRRFFFESNRSLNVEK